MTRYSALNETSSACARGWNVCWIKVQLSDSSHNNGSRESCCPIRSITYQWLHPLTFLPPQVEIRSVMRPTYRMQSWWVLWSDIRTSGITYYKLIPVHGLACNYMYFQRWHTHKSSPGLDGIGLGDIHTNLAQLYYVISRNIESPST